MTVLHAVFSMALVLGCAADDVVEGSLLGGAAELSGAGSGAWQGPDSIDGVKFQCSDGVRGSDWASYLDDTWVVFPATAEECWAEVQAHMPLAHGFMYLTNPVCRAMNKFEVLAPDGEMLATYPDYQGVGGICIPAKIVSSTTTTTTTEDLGFLGAASRMHGACLIVLAAMIAMDVAAVVW